jgi:small-conductance mechanosensitive channel
MSRRDQAHRAVAGVAIVAEAVSIVCSLVVVAVVRVRLSRDPPQYQGSVDLVNPWYGAALWALLVAVIALVLWGNLGLLRRPVGHRVAAVGVAGAVVAFACLWWALRSYVSLD